MVLVYHDSKATQSPLLRAVMAVSNAVIPVYGAILSVFAHMFPVCPPLPEPAWGFQGPWVDCQTPDALPPMGGRWVRSPTEALKNHRFPWGGESRGEQPITLNHVFGPFDLFLINVAAMADFDNQNADFVILDFTQNTIVLHPITPVFRKRA
jgi:hypothetical protein